MSTIEDFESAPVGATATHANGSRIRAMKMDEVDRYWMTQNGVYLSDAEMEQRGYLLDPLEPASTTAREALDLAWELAHPVREGQVLPKGTRYLDKTAYGLKEYTAPFDLNIYSELVSMTRTVKPLPDPEPDWLDAPAVLARIDEWDRDELDVFIPAREGDGRWAAIFSALTHHWSELTDVTPLYPKGQDQ